MNREPRPIEAAAGVIGLGIVGAIALGLKIADLYAWYTQKKPLRRT